MNKNYNYYLSEIRNPYNDIVKLQEFEFGVLELGVELCDSNK